MHLDGMSRMNMDPAAHPAFHSGKADESADASMAEDEETAPVSIHALLSSLQAVCMRIVLRPLALLFQRAVVTGVLLACCLLACAHVVVTVELEWQRLALCVSSRGVHVCGGTFVVAADRPHTVSAQFEA